MKWIFFDIDNTLFDTNELALRARKNAIKAMIDSGLKADEDEAYDKLKRIIKKHGSNHDRHFNELLKSYKQERNRYIAAAVVAYHDTKNAYLKPFPEVIPTLLELTHRGYRLGIITNGLTLKQWEKIIRLGIQHFFEIVLISEEEQTEKPYLTIFERALKKAGCEAEDAMMIGDREGDIVPAKTLGMHTVSTTEKIKADYHIQKFDELLGVVERAERKRAKSN